MTVCPKCDIDKEECDFWSVPLSGYIVRSLDDPYSWCNQCFLVFSQSERDARLLERELDGPVPAQSFRNSKRSKDERMVEGVIYKHHYLFPVWKGMLSRCTSINNKAYKTYGARGIGVCDRWRYGENNCTGFQLFVTDIHSVLGVRSDQNSSMYGDRKHGVRIGAIFLGRKDHDSWYEIGNVQWETNSYSAKEVMNRYNGGTYCRKQVDPFWVKYERWEYLM